MRKFKYSKKDAREKILEYLQKAKACIKKDPELSNKYVQKARRVSMKNKVRIPSNLQRQFCKYCHTFLLLGYNCRVRNQNKKMVYYCTTCRRYMRFPIKKKNNKK